MRRVNGVPMEGAKMRDPNCTHDKCTRVEGNTRPGYELFRVRCNKCKRLFRVLEFEILSVNGVQIKKIEGSI